jgi:gamma-glutamyltranspeptidase/glutathione hydrolase
MPRLAVPVVPLLLLLGAGCSARPAEAPVPAFAKRVEGRNGMVSSSHPDAALAGLEVLRAGGNAVDAAVAVAFALSVVDPSQTGLGGAGGLVSWHRRTGRAEAMNFYARTGSDADWARLDSAAARQPVNARAAGIPGTVAGLLEAHARWGALPRAQVLAPALRLARDGFVVSPLLARTAESARQKLEADSAAAALFLPGGQPIRAGDRLVQPELAATIRAIADSGAMAFYAGLRAERAVGKLRAMGSAATLADWTGYRPLWLRPLCTPWRGYTVLTVPPSLGGVTVLHALNLLEALRADTMGSPTARAQAATTLAGAMRLAGVDRGRWPGDPEHLAVPARGLAHPAFAASRAALVGEPDGTPLQPGDPWPHDRAGPDGTCATLDPWGPSALGAERAAAPASPGPPEEDGFTSHFSVVDREGNAVAVTFTVGVLFGSGVYVNGYFLNSGANNFNAATRGPSRFGSSTIAPTVVLRGRDVRMVVGAAGSQYIPTSVTQVVFRALALGEDPWTAIAGPRLQPAQTGIEVEPGFAPEVYAGLREAGYRVVSRVGDLMFGGVHAIVARPGGGWIGVADPRRDGIAAGW